MKFKKILLISILLLVMLTIGAASASQENVTQDNVASFDEDVKAVDADNQDNLETPGIEIDFNGNYSFEIGSDDTIDVELPETDDEVYGTLSVKINGSSAYLQQYEDDDLYYIINNGQGSPIFVDDVDCIYLSVDKMNPGRYELEVIFDSQTQGYDSTTIMANITVNAHDPVTLTVNDEYIYGINNMICIDADADVIDRLNIKINGTKVNFIKGLDNKVYVDISKLVSGSYAIEVSVLYKGIMISHNDTFNVTYKINCPENFIFKTDNYINLTLPKDADGSLLVKINNVEIANKQLVNGFANIKVPELTVGSYVVYAEYTGWDYEIETIFQSFSLIPKITVPTHMTAGENKILTFEVGEDVTGTLIVYAEYVEYANINVVGGYAEVSLANLDDGDITLELYFYDMNDIMSDWEYLVVVDSVVPRLLGGSNIKMLYFDGHAYKLTIYGSNNKLAEEGEEVEITIGKKTFYKYTDKNGVVELKIPKSIVPGKYTIKATYYDKTVKNKLTVKHMLAFKKVAVKKSAKKIVLKAKLKKKLKGKKIVFKFNGKKYSARTDKKGSAKVTVKGAALTKLKSSKKVKYQAAYLNDVVKYSAKVQK